MKNLSLRIVSALTALGALVLAYTFAQADGLYILSALVFVVMGSEVARLSLKNKISHFLLLINAAWFLAFFFVPQPVFLFFPLSLSIVVWLWWSRFSSASSPEKIYDEHPQVYTFLFYSLVCPTFILGHLNSPSAPPESALFLLFLVAAFDTLSFFWGKTCGNRLIPYKLFPSASPSKTFEGALLAALSCVPLVLGLETLFPHYSILKNLDSIFLKSASVLLLCLFSLSGDLTESLLKRASGTKDSGKVFIGHGGFFDRLDGLLFAGLLSYLLLHL